MSQEDDVIKLRKRVSDAVFGPDPDPVLIWAWAATIAALAGAVLSTLSS